jgi:hypothetical protein
MRHLLGVAVVVAVSHDVPPRPSLPPEPDAIGAVAMSTQNPRQLTMQRLPSDRRATATAARLRVRLAWDQVPGVREYALSARWATPFSWAMQSREFRVTERTATAWSGRRVTFELALAEGSYSWRLVALFGPDALGDFARPTTLSFEIR